MHQVFLGIVKTTFTEFLVGWLKSNKKCSHFIRVANQRILKVKKLRLVFLKLETITEGTSKFGKYVSENHLGICRLSKWLCSDLDEYEATDAVYIDPTGKEPSEYNKNQCSLWLKARRICFDKKATVGTLQTQIISIIDAEPDGLPPNIIEPDKITAPVSVIYLLMEALLCMVSRTMFTGSISEEDRLDVDRHIKIFLTILHSFAASKEKSKGPVTDPHPVIGKYNFITMLQFARDMFTMGSLRQLWEGDGKGEGALPLLKTKIQSVKGDWAFLAGERYYKARGIDRVAMAHVEQMKELYGKGAIPDSVQQMWNLSQEVFGALDGSLGDADDEEDNEDAEALCGTSYKEFHMYKSIEEVHEQFDESMPLSVLSFNSDEGSNGESITMGAILKGGVDMVVLRRVGSSPDCVRNGAAYFIWTLDDYTTTLTNVPRDKPVPEQREFLCGAMLHNCVFLPLLSLSANNRAGIYYVITSEWEEMCDDGNMNRPRVSGASYK
jgi:hypothetical protein